MPSMPDAIPVLNTDVTMIPAFGLMARQSVNANGIVTVGKPTADGQMCLVNGPCAIPPSTYGSATANGQGTNNPRVLLAYDGQDGVPATGETWGAATGQWTARKNRAGFLIDGGAGYGVVNASRWQDWTSSWKGVVRCCATVNLNLTTDCCAGQVIDGVTLATGDLFLAPIQTTGAEGGIYVAPATSGVTPLRALGATSGPQLVGAIANISEGTLNGNTGWGCQTPSPIIIGVTTTTWKQVFPSAQVTASWKQPVRVATTKAIALSTIVPGTVVDNNTLAAGDAVLNKDATLKKENGIWVVQPSGGPVRRSDCINPTDFYGAIVPVLTGKFNTGQGGSAWRCITNKDTLGYNLRVGIDPTTWIRDQPMISSGIGTSYTATGGLTNIGDVLYIARGTYLITVCGTVSFPSAPGLINMYLGCRNAGASPPATPKVNSSIGQYRCGSDTAKVTYQAIPMTFQELVPQDAYDADGTDDYVRFTLYLLNIFGTGASFSLTSITAIPCNIFNQY